MYYKVTSCDVFCGDVGYCEVQWRYFVEALGKFSVKGFMLLPLEAPKNEKNIL